MSKHNTERLPPVDSFFYTCECGRRVYVKYRTDFTLNDHEGCPKRVTKEG